MKILVIGSGGREHALAWKISQSPMVTQLFCVPGNAGIAQLAKCYPVKAENINGQVALAKKLKVDLVVVGPEAPLIAGIVNRLHKEDIPVFGPTKEAAQIEGSKLFCKHLLEAYEIPTAPLLDFFEDPEDALQYFHDKAKFPIVIKADKLAAGKGVAIVQTKEEAYQAIVDIMVEKKFGEAAAERILVEKFLEGKECSLIVLTDGQTILPLLPARDYKRLLDGDKGPNTGGMGSYSPLADIPTSLIRQILKTIIQPTIEALAETGSPYEGALYAGLIITDEGPKILEFNCRFGDPETQVILPLLRTDLVEMMLACLNGSLNQIKTSWSAKKTVDVVLASKGYPYKYKTGYTIHGLENNIENTLIFHAGTSSRHDKITTSGGRVLNIVGLGSTYETARNVAYQRVKTIKFDDMTYRTDIALF